jgi:hypothetical protein
MKVGRKAMALPRLPRRRQGKPKGGQKFTVGDESRLLCTESTRITQIFMSRKKKLSAPERAEPKVFFDVGANDVAMMRADFIIFLTVVCECAVA